jgi:hypothetical protein
VPLDERVEVHRVEIPPRRVRQSGNVARRDRVRDPLRKASALIRRTDFATALRHLSEAPESLTRQRRQHGIAHAEEPVPRRGFLRFEPLTDLGEGDGPEIEHRVGGEQIEVRHRLVRAGDDDIDLIRFRTEHRVVAGQRLRAGHAAAVCG